MTLRIALDPTAVPRESAKVKTVAEMLEADESQIRRLIDAGELETHGIGKRGIRIYLDSVADYQIREARKAPKSPAESEPSADSIRRRRLTVSHAAHRSAVALLQKHKIL